MHIYYNNSYCNVKVEFETFQKAQIVAKYIKAWNADLFIIKDPATYKTLQDSELLINKYTSPNYLNALKTGIPNQLAKSNGLGWDSNLYNQVLNSTAGILAATEHVKTVQGYAAASSLSSGLHHANSDTGRGFCTVNSLALGALNTDNSFILDFDAHCGGGTFSILSKYDTSNRIKIVDLSTDGFDIYDPQSRPNTFLIMSKSNDNAYLQKVEIILSSLRTILPNELDLNNTVMFYNAGVDIWPDLNSQTVTTRDNMVANFCKDLGIKVVILSAGGYGEYNQVAELHLKTLLQFI